MYTIKITANYFSDINDEPIKCLEKKGYKVDVKKFSKFKNKDELKEFIKDADGIICSLETMDKDLLKYAPNLKIISRRGVGYNNIDMNYCESNNITVARTVGEVEDAVAELNMVFILNFGRGIINHNTLMHNGIWNKEVSGGIKGKTLGILGMGAIGVNLAKKAKVFGMNIIYFNRHRNEESEKEIGGAKYVSFDELLSESDFVSILTPLTDETKGIINYENIKKMKSTAFLINCARGPIVDENDLALALKENIISGAAIDVFKTEPCSNSPLMGLENAVLTPHIGTSTYNAFSGMNLKSAENIIDFFENKLDKKYICKKI